MRAPMHPNPAWIAFAAFAAVLALVVPGVGLAVTSVTEVNGFNVVNPFATIHKVSSSNWAGYAATGAKDTVTVVSGTWTEPKITCTSGYSTTDVATWVGIDGYSNGNLVQTGASADCSGYDGLLLRLVGSSARFRDHHRLFHRSRRAYDLGFGNLRNLDREVTMKITDGSQSFSHVRTLTADPRTSAECIVERDYIGVLNQLSKFKTDTFSSCTATISGTSGGIGTFSSVDAIKMVSGSTTLATTSALTSNTKFTVTWKAYN